MVEYTDEAIKYNDNEYNFNGLNTSHILWHLQEIYNIDNFFKNLNESYTMPKHIHYMSLAEGKDFDALLIDDCMFRYSKLNESDLEDIQEYINKYAYSSALLKINEWSE